MYTCIQEACSMHDCVGSRPLWKLPKDSEPWAGACTLASAFARSSGRPGGPRSGLVLCQARHNPSFSHPPITVSPFSSPKSQCLRDHSDSVRFREWKRGNESFPTDCRARVAFGCDNDEGCLSWLTNNARRRRQQISPPPLTAATVPYAQRHPEQRSQATPAHPCARYTLLPS